MLKLSFSFFLLFSSAVFASSQFVRWTYAENTNADLSAVIDFINSKTAADFTPEDFIVGESLDLANAHFTMFNQIKDGIPVKNHSIRIWTNLETKELIQAEAQVDRLEKNSSDKSSQVDSRFLLKSLTAKQTFALANKIVKKHSDDKKIKTVTWKDYWMNGAVIREITAKASHGKHLIIVDLKTKKIKSNRYIEYPRSDYFSIPAQVYPIYEEPETMVGTILPRIPSELRYLKNEIPLYTTDPYVSLKEKHFFYSKHDPILASTPPGQAQGYWSITSVKSQARSIFNTLPKKANGSDRIILDGKYATVSLHPLAPSSFKLDFSSRPSAQYKLDWKFVITNDGPDYEFMLQTSYLGRPNQTAQDIWNLEARRLSDHDPSSYINDGFDEIQVYWAINSFFESLTPMGFTDPELSTRPFNAFLYDPDISMRDNAFYTDDTINFTTYSPEAINYARDNSTIWHELGHGIMDRLMGDQLNLADTGGLSEGLADLVSQMIIADVMWNQTYPGDQNFRIMNKTNFFLTNESHDDGEAYGGAMYDMMDAAIKLWGREGLSKFTDLILETMRYTRNHPALTANDWFLHLLFVDQMNNGKLHKAHEFKNIITTSLEGRNFNLDGSTPASMNVLINDKAILTDSSEGSRSNPLNHDLHSDEMAEYKLTVDVKNSASYSFKFPVTVRFSYRGGPLQGAIHWAQEEDGAKDIIVNNASELASLNVKALGICDYINHEDGSCSDFVYVQVINSGEQRPLAKKRFYIRVHPKN